MKGESTSPIFSWSQGGMRGPAAGRWACSTRASSALWVDCNSATSLLYPQKIVVIFPVSGRVCVSYYLCTWYGLHILSDHQFVGKLHLDCPQLTGNHDDDAASSNRVVVQRVSTKRHAAAVTSVAGSIAERDKQKSAGVESCNKWTSGQKHPGWSGGKQRRSEDELCGA